MNSPEPKPDNRLYEIPKTPPHAPREWVDDPERVARERRMPVVLDHIREDIKELKEDIKEQRGFVQSRLDRLDNRIWAIVFFCFTSFVGVMVKMVVES